MSFTKTTGGTDRAIDLARQSLLQDDGLPFADALTAEHIRQAFDAEEVSFGAGDAEFEHDDGIVYTMGITLWARVSQALFTGPQRACRAALQRVAVYYALRGGQQRSAPLDIYLQEPVVGVRPSPRKEFMTSFSVFAGTTDNTNDLSIHSTP